MLSDEFLAALSDRAAEAEELRRLPAATVADFRAGGLAHLLLPARYGGQQADFPEILDAVRRMAHGCASSAWTLGFYMLHNWMLALYGEQAQEEVFVDGPVLCPAPLAPTGRGVPADGGVRLTGRWSWATGIMDADWVMVGACVAPTPRSFRRWRCCPSATSRSTMSGTPPGCARRDPTMSSCPTCSCPSTGW